MTTIRERDGERGGKYLIADLSGGRILSVSRKSGDERVWLGVDGDPSTFHGQRGGIGTIDKLLDEWRARIALNPEMPELYQALTQLASAKRRSESRG